MNEEKLYSIIVPVYKAEKTLRRCVESIIAQSYSNFELILIDDGSPDYSGQLCDYYAEIDDRVIVIHQKNAGVSAARNKGIEIASGKYIVFIDSDDYVDSNFLECFGTENADLVISGYKLEDGDECIILADRKVTNKRTLKNIDEKTFLIESYENGLFNYAWTKRFNRKYIIEYNITFDLSVSLGEDTQFVLKYLSVIHTVCLVSDTPYHYLRYKHETLSNEKQLSLELIKKGEKSAWKAFAEAKMILGDDAESATAYRSCKEVYAYRIIELLNGDYSLAFYRFMLGQHWYKKSLAYIDELYSNEDKKFRLLLKVNSPVLLFTYNKYIKAKNRKNKTLDFSTKK